MRVTAGRAAIFAALLSASSLPSGGLHAQDVTLLSREGRLEISGTLRGWDGEYYRIDSEYGPLTVDGQGVICEGPACPELVIPRAVIRVAGAADAGAQLLPWLFSAFAEARGLRHELAAPGAGDGVLWSMQIREADGEAVLADVSFQPMEPDQLSEALNEGEVDLGLGAAVDSLGEARPLALDALVAIVAPGNPTPAISTPDLARALAGQVENWAELGGPDMPIVLHGLAPATDMGRAIALRLGISHEAAEMHPDMQSLARAVARDPWALAITGRAEIAPAVPAALTDSCGFPLLPGAMQVKAEDYPLALPVHLVSPSRRLPLFAREFIEFLGSPAADKVVARAGYIDRGVERAPMTRDGLRLINAIKGAGEDVSLADLKELVAVMDGADRLSLTFRFDDATSGLDASSRENLAQLARMIGAQRFPDQALILAGFSDGTGDARANRALSRDRAERVAQDLARLAPDLRPDQLPRIEGFGEALPMACDETATGRRLNRRVELWLVPDFTPEPEVPPAAN